MLSVTGRLSRIDDATKHLIFGFMRQLIFESDTVYILPDLVVYRCLLFYAIPGIFCNPPQCLKVSTINDSTTICKIEDDKSWKNTIYGREWMSTKSGKIYSWKIEIIKRTNNKYSKLSIAFGIISNKHHQHINQDFDSMHSYYFGSDGTSRIDGKHPGLSYRAGLVFCTGDTIISTLNLQTFQLIIKKNSGKPENSGKGEKFISRSLNVAKRSNGTKYRLAVSLRNIGDKITVTSIDESFANTQ